MCGLVRPVLKEFDFRVNLLFYLYNLNVLCKHRVSFTFNDM